VIGESTEYEDGAHFREAAQYDMRKHFRSFLHGVIRSFHIIRIATPHVAAIWAK